VKLTLASRTPLTKLPALGLEKASVLLGTLENRCLHLPRSRLLDEGFMRALRT
jgi:hypothetical protein